MDMESVFDRWSAADPDHVDQRVLLDGISWEQYVALSNTRGGKARPRMYYLEGTLELMTTSLPHEFIKKTIARCLEAWADAVGVELQGYGHATVQNRRARRAAEADECYIVGKPAERAPDLAIEVVWTHGGLDKLDVYRGLGVGEVWIWEDGRLDAWVFEKQKWVKHERSVLLPDVDLRLIERCVRIGDQVKAIRLLRSALKH